MRYPADIDVVYDTVGKPEALEVGVRFLKARGTLVKSGFHAPGPLGVEPPVLQGAELGRLATPSASRPWKAKRQHAIHHYFDLVAEAGSHRSARMLTHTFRFEQWRDALSPPRQPGQKRRREGGLRLPVDPGRAVRHLDGRGAGYRRRRLGVSGRTNLPGIGVMPAP